MHQSRDLPCGYTLQVDQVSVSSKTHIPDRCPTRRISGGRDGSFASRLYCLESSKLDRIEFYQLAIKNHVKHNSSCCYRPSAYTVQCTAGITLRIQVQPFPRPACPARPRSSPSWTSARNRCLYFKEI